MTDMLVRLYDDPKEIALPEGIKIKRALAIDKKLLDKFIATHFLDICSGWQDECQSTLFRHPTTCFIATFKSEIIGFACYDGTAKGMVGPIGVDPGFRNKNIATSLLQHCFEAMKMDGYAYAVIGWVSSEDFYAKSCNAITIANSFPGIYQRMVIEH